MKTRTTWRRVLCVVAALGLALTVSGCEGGGGKPAEPEPDLGDGRPPELIGNGVVYGKVISAESGKGIGGVGVTLQIGNIHTLSTTTGESAAAAPAAAPAAEPAAQQKKAQSVSYGSAAVDSGAFEIPSIPAGTHYITFSKAGLETIQLPVTVPVSDEKQVFIPVTYGSDAFVKMALGFDAKFIVTLNDKPAQDILVTVLPDGYWYGSHDFNATTDANGLATIAGLSQKGSYDVVVSPQDTNGDGLIDFSTYFKPFCVIEDGCSGEYGFGKLASKDEAVPIVLEPMKPGVEAKVIATSCKGQPVAFATCDLPKGEPLRLIFNRPVQLVSTGKIVYGAPDLLNKDGAAPDIEVVMTPAMSALDVILTLTPDKELLEGHKYQLYMAKGVDKLLVTYTAKNEVKQLEIDDLKSFYVIPAAKLDIAAVMLDNYNFKAGADASTFPAQLVYIKFPKMVKGRVIVKAKTEEATVKTYDGVDPNLEPKTIEFDGCETIADHKRSGTTPCQDNVCGCDISGNCGTSALFYRCSLGDFNMKDNGAQKNDITLVIEATDSLGEKINQEVTLPVK